jgi:hypothetical protein
MKKLLCCFCGLMVTSSALRATPIFADNFSGYNPSPAGLVGQGPWTITGASVINPIAVNGSGQVPMANNGQDINGAFPGGAVTLNPGDTIYAGVTLNVSAALAGGDYFLHFSPNAGNTTIFPSRLFVRSDGAGYQLGWSESSITVPIPAAFPTSGVNDLVFGTTYRVVFAYYNISGPLNDTGSVYVNPSDLNNEGGNTAYLTKSWTQTLAETETMGTINLRQGTASIAPTLTVDDLDVSLNSFADVSVWTPIPEPTSLSLLGGFGLLAWYISRRRK